MTTTGMANLAVRVSDLDEAGAFSVEAGAVVQDRSEFMEQVLAPEGEQR